MSAQPTERPSSLPPLPTRPSAALRDSLMHALAAAEHLTAYAPALPSSIETSTYRFGPLEHGEYRLSAHCTTAADVLLLAEWLSVSPVVTPQADGWWKTEAEGVVQGVVVRAWASQVADAPVEYALTERTEAGER